MHSVLRAAFEELARVGYRGMRIEDVATRAAVNKTTVYRRWPTKEELVRAALLTMTRDASSAPNKGSLRADLLELARRRAAFARSSEGQSLLRMIAAEGPDSELMAIARSIQQAREAVPRAVVESAAARGELAPDADMTLLFDVLRATVRDKLLVRHESIDDRFLGRLVDLLLYGALRSDERGKKTRRG